MAEEASVARGERLDGLDGLRTAAVLFVVMCHVSTYAVKAGAASVSSDAFHGLHRWAIPAFFMVSGYLAARSPWTWPRLRGRLRRLLVPYALWTAVYLALELGTGLRDSLSARSALLVIFFGQGSWHLWFLPALAGCHVVHAWARTDARRWTVVVLGLLVMSLQVLGGRLAAAPAVVVNYSVVGWAGVYMTGAVMTRWRRRIPGWAVVASSAATLGILLGVRLGLGTGPLPSLVVAVAAVLGPLVVIGDIVSGGDALRMSRLAPLGSFSLGVYLVHMLPVDALRLYGALQAPMGLAAMLIALGFVVACSLGIVLLLRAVPYGWVLLGDAPPVMKESESTSESLSA